MIGARIGNFQIVRQLGAGGMGEVFLGVHEAIGTKVAIKMLQPHISANKEHVQRFFNEAIAAAKIQHAGIGKIFDVGFDPQGRAYLVMEFLDGETLAARIRRLGRLPLGMIGDIGKQIASVLGAVHKAGITHRDLKPDNIFLVPDAELPSGERVKVLDFGIAKLSGHNMALTSTAAGTMGTPAYMSPEQWKNSKNVDWRADAYSLGCLAFEMASGRPPFVAETIGEACAKHLTEEAPRVSSVVAAPTALDLLIASLLAKTPEQRPASMVEVGNAFAGLAKVLEQGMAATLPPELPPTGARVPVGAPTARSGIGAAASAPIPMIQPTVPPVTTLGGAAGAVPAAVAAKGGRGLLIALVAAGGALVAVVIVLIVVLSSSKRAPDELAAALPSPDASPAAKPIVTPAPEPAARPLEAPPTTAPTPPADAPAKASEPAPPPRAATGTLVVNATPFGTVYVDGRRVGNTPLTIEMPVGSHTVRVARGTVTASRLVSIKDGQASKVTVDLADPKPPPTTGPVTSCDEVACLLDPSRACCSKFRKPGKTTPRINSSDLPEALDRMMISVGINAVKARVSSCGEKTGAAGTVKTTVKVNPDGTVASVTITDAPDTGLGACVSSAVQRAHFARTQTGGTFTYPFRF